MKMLCSICKSPRIISARHDSDWGGGNRLGTVNSLDSYADYDVNNDGDVVGFGDIDIYVCLACQFTWQRYTDPEKILSKLIK